MKTNLRLPELLSPAGNFEKMKFALSYGADAVYLAGRSFGMRSAAGNFSDDDLKKAVKYVHALNKKLYVTVNTMPRSSEMTALEEYLTFLEEIRPDALIVADLGVLSLAKRFAPHLDIHISTQAAIVNHESCNMWYDLGAKRVVLARELSFEDIASIRQKSAPSLEIETFIHGAMCVSFSGRCMLSEFYTNRDANRGSCTQPCRWIYHFSEEKRLEEQLDAEFHAGEGTYIFGSKDMCMIEHVPDLINAGISSLKIEGRMKSAYYTAAVSNCYRMCLDKYKLDPDSYVFDSSLLKELDSVSHREYCTGYYYGHPLSQPNLASNSGYMKEKSFLAIVDEKLGEGIYKCTQKNKMTLNTAVEYLSPGYIGKKLDFQGLWDIEHTPIESTPHPQMEFILKTSSDLKVGDILREACN